MPFPKLIKDDSHCRLASADLVEEYNGIARFFDEAKVLRAVSESDEFGRLGERLNKIRDQIERNHYRIGFVGPSQVGKSTSFNNVLGMNKALLGPEEYARLTPAAEGIGEAMTASITRLRKAEKNRCTVHYLTKALHEARCEHLGFPGPHDDKAIAEIIQNLQAQIEQRDEEEREEMAAAAGTDEAELGERPLKTLDKTHRYFQSFQQHGDLLGETREIPYADRGQYINHAPGKPPSAQWLQAYVEIEFETDNISDELEMIDLPGLAASDWDDMITGEFLPDLDAALYFLNCEGNINDNAFNNFVEQMQGQFGRDLTGRLWVVAFHVESPSEIKVEGDEHGNSFFDSIENSISEKNIPLKQVVFISNLWYQQFLQDEWDAKAHFSRSPFNFSFDENGDFRLSDAWEKHSELAASFKRMFTQGGIDELRDLMQSVIAEKVKQHVDRKCRRDLNRLRQDLEMLVRLMRDRAGMRPEQMFAAGASATSLDILSDKLRFDRSLYAEPSIRVIEKLVFQFNRLFPEDFVGNIAEGHQTLLMPLALMAEKEIRDQMLPALYQLARAVIELKIGDDGRQLQVPVRVERTAMSAERCNALEAWDKFQAYDVNRGEISKTLTDELQRSRLFSEVDQSESFTSVKDYRYFMHLRIKMLIYSVCSQATRQMQHRLAELSRSLRFLGQEAGPGQRDLGDETAYDNLLSQFCGVS